jgi:hypothetical protein
MAFTDHCDIFIAVLEAGINRVLTHVRRQRPSMFNYGSQAVKDGSDPGFALRHRLLRAAHEGRG